MNLGLSGRLTRATIGSPLTPLFLLASLAVGLIAVAVIPREEEPQISVPMVDIRVNADRIISRGCFLMTSSIGAFSTLSVSRSF